MYTVLVEKIFGVRHRSVWQHCVRGSMDGLSYIHPDKPVASYALGYEPPRYPVPAPIYRVDWFVYPTQVAFWFMDQEFPVYGYVRPKEGSGGIYYHWSSKPWRAEW